METISLILLCLNMGIQSHQGMVDNVGEDYLNNGFASFTIDRSERNLDFSGNKHVVPVISATLTYIDNNHFTIINETLIEEDFEYIDGDIMTGLIPKGLSL